MDDINAPAIGAHEIVDSLDREFAHLHSRSRAIIMSTPDDILYSGAESGRESGHNQIRSVGESVLRSAAVIEQTFGGITANLWDDPFEWALPEHLSTPAKVIGYLEEVEATRQRAFSSFTTDGCLLKRVATPSEETPTLVALLLDTLVRAIYFQSQAVGTLKNLSGISTPGFII